MHCHSAKQVLVSARLLQLRQPLLNKPSAMHNRRAHRLPVSAAASQQKTAEPLRAPGSESNFVGLPADRKDIGITSPVSDRQMQVTCSSDDVSDAAARYVVYYTF